MFIPLFLSVGRYKALPLRELQNSCVSAWRKVQRPAVDHALRGQP